MAAQLALDLDNEEEITGDLLRNFCLPKYTYYYTALTFPALSS